MVRSPSRDEAAPAPAPASAPSPSATKLIAFYLPQFHPIPENDAWWGTGFTEWTNVGRATPQFVGHQQPRLPAAGLGTYDLRRPEVQIQQAALARRYGVHGFCYYTYWFGGRRLLERPLEILLHEPRIDIPFCLCYANSSWTRRWDGQEQDRLITQAHTPDDDVAFIRSLFPYLRDPRYIRVEGKPLLLAYHTRLFPDPAATTRRWRQACRDAGIGELFLVRAEIFDDLTPAPAIGFDASYEFPPNGLDARPPTVSVTPLGGFAGTVVDYRLAAEGYKRRARPAHPFFRCVAPGWDNTPRTRTRALILKDASPAAYFDWLSFALHDTARHNAPDHRIVFVNAWNEWGEGAHLEPCERDGYRYLEATRDALRVHALEWPGDATGAAANGPSDDQALARVLAAYLRAQSAEVALVRGEMEESRVLLARPHMRFMRAAHDLARGARNRLRALLRP